MIEGSGAYRVFSIYAYSTNADTYTCFAFLYGCWTLLLSQWGGRTRAPQTRRQRCLLPNFPPTLYLFNLAPNRNMNIPLPLSKDDLEERSIQLRSELKQWERDFAASHDGRKAGREDIKQHPDIGHYILSTSSCFTYLICILAAFKYKSYDRLRQTISQPAQVDRRKYSPVPSKKRLGGFHESSADNAWMQTPSKRAKHAHPLHSQPVNAFASRPLHPALLDPYDPPTSTLLSPSKVRISLGPTPQKDGKVLGLFDVISSGSIDRTPSKRKILDPVEGNAPRVAVTPSKRSAAVCETQKLPGSASKGEGLSIVFTPASHRVSKTKPSSTPVSATGVPRLNIDNTPAFLRRDSQRAVTAAPIASQENEDGEGEAVVWSPIVPRRTSKLYRPPAAGRGLSALVRGLRELEEERLDEDLDLLREMEGASTFESFASKMSNQMKIVQPPSILVGDGQAPEMPLGPDKAIESEEEGIENMEGKTRDGRPLKVWKKKGQKRTTRAVKMRPITAKWKAEPAWKGVAESEEDEEAGVETVVETQVAERVIGGEEAAKSPVSDDEYAAHLEADEDMGSDTMETKIAKWKRQKKDAKQAKEDDKKEGFAQKVKKKISATAHANFKALKLRSKNSKSKGGSSRFRKKR